MKAKYAVWLTFFLNLTYTIVEFIAGGVFDSSVVLADSVHDLGDAITIGISAFLETISNREEDRRYTLGYKRFSLLGALVTSVILIIGSILVILENVTKIFNPQPVNDDGILWLGIISIFILTKALPRCWSTLKIFLDAVPEGVETGDLEKDLETLTNVKSVNQLSIWSMDGLENNAIIHLCLEDWEQMTETKNQVRQLLEERGIQNITIEVDTSQGDHAQHKRKVIALEQSHGHQH